MLVCCFLTVVYLYAASGTRLATHLPRQAGFAIYSMSLKPAKQASEEVQELEAKLFEHAEGEHAVANRLTLPVSKLYKMITSDGVSAETLAHMDDDVVTHVTVLSLEYNWLHQTDPADRHLFVRKCDCDLFQLIEKRREAFPNQGVLVTGNPGIGLCNQLASSTHLQREELVSLILLLSTETQAQRWHSSVRWTHPFRER